MQQRRERTTPHFMRCQPCALQGKTFSRHSALEIAISRDLVKAGHWPVELGKTYSFLLELRATGDYGGELHVSREDIANALTGTRRILEVVHKSNPDQFPFPEPT